MGAAEEDSVPYSLGRGRNGSILVSPTFLTTPYASNRYVRSMSVRFGIDIIYVRLYGFAVIGLGYFTSSLFTVTVGVF
jgi:hypothetical protein